MRELILQGMIKLMESEVYLRCKAADVRLVEGLLSDVSEDFSKFLKSKLNKDKKVSVKMYPQDPLKDDIIGGVVLYCNGFKTVYDNTLKVRLNLTFEESIPDIRKMMFTSITK